MSTIPQLVAQVALATPQAVALETNAHRMTYGELDAQASRLAAELVRLGAERDAIVGICLPRSFEQIVACLAALKAGAAYLPLAADWPKERLQFVLRDADARIVITSDALADTLAAEGRSVIRDSHFTALQDPPPDNASEICQEQLAYLIYTSGSTGEPKGVEVTHGNLMNLISWHREAFAMSASDRMSHLAGLSFDASVWEVWAALTVGASLVLPDDAARTSPILLRNWVIDNKITVAFVPTVLAEPMIKARWPAETSLRVLLTGAETLHNFPRGDLPFEVVNNYGPTECTVVSTSGVVRSEPDQADLPGIGRPISNTRIYLLDEAGNPVANGDSGEIYIAGASVARGYRNRPDLTAERFLPDPFGAVEGGRMYRTGDLGRLLPDGQIMFQGRRDNQEKIRGHRVEPDEITSKLNQHAAVSASAVVGDGPERDRRLIAYIVQAEDAQLTAEELRNYLAQSLPDYMIPTVFLTVPALPQTSNGKLDKAALPKPDAAEALPASEHRLPATPTEHRVAAIVAEVLRVERVGVDDNFFLLGGHSLLGTQVVLQVRDVFGIELTLRHLFTAPTVGRLAATIETMIVQKVHAMSDEEAQRQVTQLSLVG